MLYAKLSLVGILMSLLCGEVFAVTFESAMQRPTVIELYTSEGCSSCPPAERWLNRFVDNDELWQQYFPMAWHVDYWDSIGWPDRFASKRYSQRQRRYQQQTALRSVYTPGLLVNGSAWRGWILGSDVPGQQPTEVGILHVELDKQRFTASFKPALENARKAYNLHVAVLGFGLSTQVRRGENSGKTLEHEFVVLADQQFDGSGLGWAGDLPVVSDAGSGVEKLAVVFWLETSSSPVPIQMTGGWIGD